ncbi:Gfo/Idh/MocA family oxidoreductase [Paraburkholderia elongata]|uniref:Gfo/Idh/MocA family oxidoreductase n=1 Tax=Paraburkholderia elongata TaxID=2675747 RepID=UPI001F2B658D|nr:Gfo/Idh/MocA family oxidoreductase [Paraburkholderia elongata]
MFGSDASTDCAAIVDSDHIDAVVIGTPTDAHIRFMQQVVANGKAVLCEKPIDLDMEKSLAAARELERQKGASCSVSIVSSIPSRRRSGRPLMRAM